MVEITISRFTLTFCTTFLLSSIWSPGVAGASSNVSQHNVKGFRTGRFYTFTNLATGKVLSVLSGNSSSGTLLGSVVLDWDNDLMTQKWIALQVPIPKFVALARNAGESPVKFYLFPKAQPSWDWSSLNKGNGTRSSPTLDQLPEQIQALTLDSSTGNLTIETLQKGDSSQQWVTESGLQENVFLLRNVGNNQCVKNFDYKSASLLQRIASLISRIRKPYKAPQNPLGTLDCSAKDISQKWTYDLS